MKTMAERAKGLISNQINGSMRFKELEGLTGISGATWRTWWTKDKPPSGEMIESMGKIWPEYIFWLVTGLTDPLAGHVGIKTESKESQRQEFLGNWSNYPVKYTEEYFNEIRRLMAVMVERSEKGMSDDSLLGSELERLHYVKEMRIHEIEQEINLQKNRVKFHA